jgi:hypothetical protein
MCMSGETIVKTFKADAATLMQSFYSSPLLP